MFLLSKQQVISKNTYLWHCKDTVTKAPECIICYTKLKQLYSVGMLTRVCILQQHTWVTTGGVSPLPSEEDNCELVEVTDEEVQQVIQSIPKLDTLILVKKMLKNHSFQVRNLCNVHHWHRVVGCVVCDNVIELRSVQCAAVWIVCVPQCGLCVSAVWTVCVYCTVDWVFTAVWIECVLQCGLCVYCSVDCLCTAVWIVCVC